jgi:hypothetical protein
VRRNSGAISAKYVIGGGAIMAACWQSWQPAKRICNIKMRQYRNAAFMKACHQRAATKPASSARKAINGGEMAKKKRKKTQRKAKKK